MQFGSSGSSFSSFSFLMFLHSLTYIQSIGRSSQSKYGRSERNTSSCCFGEAFTLPIVRNLLIAILLVFTAAYLSFFSFFPFLLLIYPLPAPPSLSFPSLFAFLSLSFSSLFSLSLPSFFPFMPHYLSHPLSPLPSFLFPFLTWK